MKSANQPLQMRVEETMNDLKFSATRHKMVQKITTRVRVTSDQIGRKILADLANAAG